MTLKPVIELTDRELAAELEHIGKMLDGGPVGTNLDARGRLAALVREASKRMKWPSRRRAAA